MHREFPPIALFAAVLLLLPLPWHWRAGNIATLAIIFWLFITNVIYAVDAIIWSDNVDIVVPVWCDMTSKFIIGANFALPAACLSICIHLERVASVRQARTTMMEKRHRQIFEVLMCFGLPLLFMGLHYIVQGHRFDIIEGYGCRPTTYISIPAIFIIYIPPLLMAVACLVFASLALRHFIARRITFALHLDASHSALTTSRYLRLILMSILQMIWSISLTSFTIWFTFSGGPLRPWTSWDFVHSNFSRIDAYPAVFIPQFVDRSYYVLWWTVPASSFIFVAFFAFGKDAVEDYKTCFAWVAQRIFGRQMTYGSKGSFGSLPMLRATHSGTIPAPYRPDISSKTIPSTLSPSTPQALRKSKQSFDELSNDSASDMSCRESMSSHLRHPEPFPTRASFAFPPATTQPRCDVVYHDTPPSPLSPPSPLTPPPRSRIRADAGHQAPSTPRPLTYPSLDTPYRFDAP